MDAAPGQGLPGLLGRNRVLTCGRVRRSLAMARGLGLKNIHVVHLMINAGVDSAAIHERLRARGSISQRTCSIQFLVAIGFFCVLQVLSQLDRHPVVVGSGRSEPHRKLTRLAESLHCILGRECHGRSYV